MRIVDTEEEVQEHQVTMLMKLFNMSRSFANEYIEMLKRPIGISTDEEEPQFLSKIIFGG